MLINLFLLINYFSKGLCIASNEIIPAFIKYVIEGYLPFYCGGNEGKHDQ